jgi:hypothetical protein
MANSHVCSAYSALTTRQNVMDVASVEANYECASDKATCWVARFIPVVASSGASQATKAV